MTRHKRFGATLATALCAALIFPAGVLAATPRPKPLSAAPTSPEGSLRVFFKHADKRTKLEFHVATAKKPKPFVIATDIQSQTLPQFYISYKDRAQKSREDPTFRVPFSTHPKHVVAFSGLDLAWYVKPKFSYYEVAQVNKSVLKWDEMFPDALTAKFKLDVQYNADADEVEFYLNDQYAGRIEGSGRLKGVLVYGAEPKVYSLDVGIDLDLEPDGPEVTFEPYMPVKDAARILHSVGKYRASKLLENDARLSIMPGRHDFGDVVLDVFAPGDSVDIGLHRKMNGRESNMFDDEYYMRTAYNTCPEYAHYCVPNGFYTHAWVLCADVPQTNRVPVLGTQVTRFSGLGDGMVAHSRLDLSQPDLPNVRKVGDLTYLEGGVEKTVPLMLVKHELNTGRILDLLNDKPVYFKTDKRPGQYLTRPLAKVHDYLDFEFTGTGIWSPQRSSIQVFGCALAESPYKIEMAQSERGNIFHNDEKPETGVELIAKKPSTRGSIEYRIYDADFKSLLTNAIPFTLAEAGKPEIVNIPLDMAEPGWYGLDFTFRDAAGEALMRHEAAFALLGEDTREAGFESPYAAWPQMGNYDPVKDDFPDAGRHNSNPDRLEVAEIMHKAGYHTSWHMPLKSEDEIPEYKMTFSMFSIGGRPYSPDTPDFERRLADGVADIKEKRARFPHCDTVMVLHEPGGRDLADELVDKPVEIKPYDPDHGDPATRFATICAQTVRNEFPDMKTQFSNGSSSSRMMAILLSNGLAPSLIDYLGIESKGFQTMPEERANLEAPGMAWALRETGRVFGADKPVSACNEYVFRPERDVTPDSDYLFVTRYSLRDYLISLGWNFRHISTGHIEDCKSNYYNTNWGAGGQCKFFPYSYPKRLYVALATLTKVMDKTTFSRVLDDDELSTYALEFTRNRKIPDFAYAFWTPKYEVVMEVAFPADARVTRVHAFGKSEPVVLNADGAATLAFDGLPTYLVASKPALSAKVVKHVPALLPDAKAVEIARFSAADGSIEKSEARGTRFPVPGTFALRDVKDPDMGDSLEVALLPEGRIFSNLVGEYAFVRLRAPVKVSLADGERAAVWVRGNSSFGDIHLVMEGPDGKTFLQKIGRQFFEGWQCLDIPMQGSRETRALGHEFTIAGFIVESTRFALDPLEMRPVTRHPRIHSIVKYSVGATR